MNEWAPHAIHNQQVDLDVNKKAALQQWRQHVRKNVRQGTKAGHRITKPPLEESVVVVQGKDGHHTTAIDAVVENHADIWRKWWQSREEQMIIDRECWREDELNFTPFTGELVKAVARTFPAKTAQPCGYHPRVFAAISDDLAEAVAHQFTVWERAAWMPTSETCVEVCLIGKAARRLCERD